MRDVIAWDEVLIFHCLAPVCAAVIFMGLSFGVLQLIVAAPSKALVIGVGIFHIVVVLPYLVYSQHRKAMRSGRVYPWQR